MAFITTQWLKGTVERNRGHFPVRVTVEPGTPSDNWGERNQIAAHIQATRDDHSYQTLYFTQEDIAAVLPYLVRWSSLKAKAEAATAALIDISERDLAVFLEELFVRRRAAR